MSLSRSSWFAVVLALLAGCGGVTIPPGKLACGKHGECPSGLECGVRNLCWEKGHRVDAAVDADAAVDGDAASSRPDTALDTPVDAAVDVGEPADADAGASDAVPEAGMPEVAPEVPTCPANQHLCPVGCVMNDSPQTCGTSCSPCLDPANGGTATCDGTKCDGTCPTGKKLCLGACVDTAAPCGDTCTAAGTHLCDKSCPSVMDVNACGKSCSPCGVPANSVGATCDGTTCGFTCKTGFHPCGAACPSESDPTACGTACTVCPTDPNGSAVCAGGGCGLQCRSGFHVCGTKCVSNGDVGSCGASSCSACPEITGGTATCDGVKCGGTCPGTQVVCNGACVAANAACGPCPSGTHNCSGICVANTSTNTCGTSCAACTKPNGASQTSCDGTTCDFACGTGYHRCGASCAANDDATACGGSCTKCPTDPHGVASCQANGTCALSCNTGYHPCGNACVSNNDVNNCGATACGAPCSAPAGGTVSCDGVSCLPVCTSASQYNCQGTCIDKALACAGMCQVAGQHVCSGFCRANDVSYCGTTCQTCPVPPANGSASCSGTSCGIMCAGGYRNCAGTSLCVSATAPACCASSECTAAPTGTVGVCSNNVCTYPCNTPTYKQCGGACIPAANCCSNGDCSSSKPICSNGTCVGRPNGQVCAGGAECATGNCVDGVCCDLACAGQCQACDLNGFVGTCKPVTGTPHRTAQPVRALCGGDALCPGTCNGSTTATCTYPSNQCRASSCSGRTQINSAVCDVAGNCPAQTTTSCQFACVASSGTCGGSCIPGTTRCSGNTPQTCNSDGIYVGNTACSGGTPKCDPASHLCVALNLNEVCSSDTQCGSGFCVPSGANSVCCDSRCSGGCNAGCAGGSCVHVSKASRTGCGTRTGSIPGYNDLSLMCDGLGNCVGPTVPCGNSHVACDLTVKACCQDFPSGSGFSVDCATPSACCNGSNCNGGTDRRWYECKSNLDCPSNLKCCVSVNFLGSYGEQFSECRAACDGTNNFNGLVECDPNRSTSAQCATGEACNVSDSDYALCY
jgi:hypothetical protein